MIARGAMCPLCGMPGRMAAQRARRPPPPPTSAPPGDWPSPPPVPYRGNGPDVIVIAPLHLLMASIPVVALVMLTVAYVAGICTASAIYFGAVLGLTGERVRQLTGKAG